MQMRKFMREKMRTLGPEQYQKFVCQEIIHDWNKLVDECIAAKVKPVALEHAVLFVYVSNAAFKDQLKFFTEEIIDAINTAFNEDEPIVKEIRLAKAYQVADLPQEFRDESAQVNKSTLTLEQIELTDEEVKRCEEQASKISNENLRQTVKQTLISRARLQKFRLATGWHKCASCDVLCPPQENFCEVCRIKQHEAMVKEIYKILYDNPWLNYRDVQRLLLEEMPQMRNECSFDVIDSARASLIQKVAGAIRFGEEDTPDVRKLVMLEKRLPPDKLTPTIIRQTLLDLQFNLADQVLLLRYNARGKSRKNH